MRYSINILKSREIELVKDFKWIVKCRSSRNLTEETEQAMKAIKSRMLDIQDTIKLLEQCSL